MYSCGMPFDSLAGIGPEDIYQFTPQNSGDVTLMLTGLNCQVDLYILDSTCDSDSGCITGNTTTGTSSKSVMFTASASEVYYVVVETSLVGGTPSWPCTYMLSAEVAAGTGCSEDCDNGVDDDADGDVDCDDTDCFGQCLCSTDTDSDGLCDLFDEDDDNDGVDDIDDIDPLDPATCTDADGDGCDDCSIGVDGFGSLPDNDPSNDGVDNDGDGHCDSGDNCPTSFNPMQTDADGDGTGDTCDPDIVSLQNIGIGIDSPRTKLHIREGALFLDAGSVIFRSPNGNCWLFTADDSGQLNSTQIDCPD
jgi:hypothetical protein